MDRFLFFFPEAATTLNNISGQLFRFLFPACIEQLINQGGLIDVFITTQYHFLKVLHSYRI